MTRESIPTGHRSFFEQFLRILVVGTLAMLMFYLKILGGILKTGIRLIQRTP